MPVACCVYNCKNTWKKNSKIKFYRFPFKNGKVMKYWIAATGHNNWFPYSDARICSVHFTDNDYHNNKEHIKRRHLKPDVIPTQNIHASMLQVLQEDTHTLQMSQVDKTHKFNEYDQSSVIQVNEELMNEECDATSASPKRSIHFNYNELINENKKLKQLIHDLQESVEERLNQQANVFRKKLMNKKEAIYKKKLEMTRNKTKTLNKNIQRKGKKITNLRTLFKELKSKNMLENDDALSSQTSIYILDR